jgi:hypothetical protein
MSVVYVAEQVDLGSITGLAMEHQLATIIELELQCPDVACLDVPKACACAPCAWHS